MNGGIGAQPVAEVFVILLLFVVVFALLARKLQTPYPIVLVIAGLVLSAIPGTPHIQLNPRLVFTVVLPPLLYAAAWTTSWREFRHNLVSVVSLAFGLVSFTIAGVALAVTGLFPGFDWRLGVILGAAVAPTDAVAAAAIASQVGLPRRIVDLLEGESLVNDATGLLALEFGLALVFGGATPTVGTGLLRLGYLIVAGLGTGVLIALVVDRIERWIDDGPNRDLDLPDGALRRIPWSGSHRCVGRIRGRRVRADLESSERRILFSVGPFAGLLRVDSGGLHP